METRTGVQPEEVGTRLLPSCPSETKVRDLAGTGWCTVNDAEIIREAIRLLQKRGWVQGDLANQDGYCLMGALATAEHNKVPSIQNEGRPYYFAIHDVIREQYGKQYGNSGRGWALTDWNDIAGRTKEEVIAVLEKAAAKLEEQV